VSSENGQPQGSRRLNLKEVKEAPGISDESVGMELRAMRLQRGETVAQISQVLRIRKDLVEAIEHSRQDLLPGQAYAVGFVRSYADYLRLDTADVVRRYKAELAALEPQGHFAIPVPEEEQRFSFVSIGVILLCLAGAVAGAWYLAMQAGWIGGSRPLGSTVAETPVEPVGTTPQPETTDPVGPAPTLAPPVVAPTPTPLPTPTPTPTPVPRPGGIVPAAPGELPQAATGREMGKSNATARIVFIARRETRLVITAPDARQPYVARTLSVGDSYRVPRKDNLVMQATDAGALDVILDGEFIGRAGADGVPITDFALSAAAYGAADLPEPTAAPTPAPTATPTPQPEAVPPPAVAPQPTVVPAPTPTPAGAAPND
jgi:cytoskeleton protein RodZ